MEPNLNLIGVREPGGLAMLVWTVSSRGCGMADRHGVDLDFYQSNHEGELIDIIQSCRKS